MLDGSKESWFGVIARESESFTRRLHQEMMLSWDLGADTGLAMFLDPKSRLLQVVRMRWRSAGVVFERARRSIPQTRDNTWSRVSIERLRKGDVDDIVGKNKLNALALRLRGKIRQKMRMRIWG
jgi:hypothetical protein